MLQVMLDLETLSTRVNAVVLSIGAVAFDPVKDIVADSYYANLDIETQVRDGGHIDAGTLLWWMKQDEAARLRAFASGGDTLSAITSFSRWLAAICPNKEELKVWGNGAAFDNAILANLYTRMDMVTPWHFYNDRCYRTVKSMRTNIKLERVGVHHDPRDDAESQARHLIKILQAIG